MAPTPGINAGASLLAAPEAGAWHHLGITAPAHQLVMLVEDRRRVRAELRTVRVVNPPLVEPGRPQAPVSPQSRQVVQVPVRTTGGPELHRHFHTPFYFFCCRASRRAPNIFAMSSLVFGRVSGNISK